MSALAQRRPAARPTPRAEPAAQARPNALAAMIASTASGAEHLLGESKLGETPTGALLGLGLGAVSNAAVRKAEGGRYGAKALKDDLLVDAGKGVATKGATSLAKSANPLGVAKYLDDGNKSFGGKLAGAGIGGLVDGGLSLAENFGAWRRGKMDTAAYAADALVEGGMGVATTMAGIGLAELGGAAGSALGLTLGPAGVLLGGAAGAALGAGLAYAAEASGFTQFAKDKAAGGLRMGGKALGKVDAFATKHHGALQGVTGAAVKAAGPALASVTGLGALGAAPELLQRWGAARDATSESAAADRADRPRAARAARSPSAAPAW